MTRSPRTLANDVRTSARITSAKKGAWSHGGERIRLNELCQFESREICINISFSEIGEGEVTSNPDEPEQTHPLAPRKETGLSPSHSYSKTNDNHANDPSSPIHVLGTSSGSIPECQPTEPDPESVEGKDGIDGLMQVSSASEWPSATECGVGIIAGRC
jgi:hypothetical protein